MRDREIDFARELVSFLQHRVASPFHEIAPHFPDQDEWSVIKLAHLEKLLRERHFQKRSIPAGNDDERIGNDHKMMEP